jgi:signal transduction histidine kinase
MRPRRDCVKKSLFARYFSLSAWVILVGISILGMMMVALSARYFNADKLDVLTRKATQAAAMVSANYAENDFRYINSWIVQSNFAILSEAAEAEIFLANSDGEIILCIDRASCDYTGNSVPVHVTSLAKSGGFRGTDRLGGLYNEPTYVVGLPVKVQGDVIGIVFATQTAATMSAFLMEVLRIFLIGAALVIFISFVAIYFATETLIRPLRAMARATECFSKGDFSARVPVEGDEEVEQLALAFNNMAASLAAFEETRRSFVANVSHELRTPMTTIGGFIDGILDGTIPPEKTKYYLQTVSQEVTRLSRLVVSMLNISRIEAGEMELRPQVVDVHEAVMRTVFAFERAIEEKGIEVKGLEAEKVFVEADSDMLHQIIFNLIENAVKFTNEKGSIEVAYFVEGKMVAVSVKNTGQGIPKEDLPHLFERFYKSDRSRSADRSGVGLGLHIVKSLVNLHGGTITVKSVEGEYADFIITLPVAEARNMPPLFRKSEKSK